MGAIHVQTVKQEYIQQDYMLILLNLAFFILAQYMNSGLNKFTRVTVECMCMLYTRLVNRYKKLLPINEVPDEMLEYYRSEISQFVFPPTVTADQKLKFCMVIDYLAQLTSDQKEFEP